MTKLHDPLSFDGYDDYLEEVFRSIKAQFSLNDTEIGIVREVNRILREPTPTVQTGIESRVSRIDSLRVEVQNLLYIVESKISDAEYDYHTVYDLEFTRLTRAGRPSQQAIESEIHSKDEVMKDKRRLLENYRDFKNLLLGYLKSLSSSKDTCMKKWGYV